MLVQNFNEHFNTHIYNAYCIYLNVQQLDNKYIKVNSMYVQTKKKLFS